MEASLDIDLRAPAAAPGPAARPRGDRAGAWLLAALVGVTAARLVHWLLVPPNSDEAYYWLWGLHPALSYFDHPPLNAWIQGAAHAIFGRSLLVLRLPAALTTAGSLALVMRLAARLGGGGRRLRAAAAAAFLASPLLAMLAAFAWGDHLLVFFVLLAGALFLDVLEEVARGGRGSTARLLGGGLALGLAGLAKYSAVFLAVGLAAAIAADPRLRRLLRDPRLWAAAGLCLAVLSPVLAWNATHGLASFRFHLSRGFGHLGRGVLPFAVPSLLLLSPPLAWAMALAARRAGAGSGPRADVHRALALATFAASTAVFLGLSFVTWSLYYWNVVAYLLLVPMAAVVLAARPRLLGWHAGVGAALAAAMAVHGAVVPLTALVPGIDDEDSLEPWGWGEVAAAVRAQAAKGGADLVAATDYRPGAHLAWALEDGSVKVMSLRPSEFDQWLDARALRGRSALVVVDRRAPLGALGDRFERLERVAVVPVVRLGVHLKDYELWRGTGFDGAWPPPAAPGAGH